jgi:hypothetical protein
MVRVCYICCDKYEEHKSSNPHACGKCRIDKVYPQIEGITRDIVKAFGTLKLKKKNEELYKDVLLASDKFRYGVPFSKTLRKVALVLSCSCGCKRKSSVSFIMEKHEIEDAVDSNTPWTIESSKANKCKCLLAEKACLGCDLYQEIEIMILKIKQIIRKRNSEMIKL